MVRKQLSTQIRRDIPICTHRVLSGTPRERADETTQGKIDPWPPRPLSRLPAPEFLEARAVPPEGWSPVERSWPRRAGSATAGSSRPAANDRLSDRLRTATALPSLSLVKRTRAGGQQDTCGSALADRTSRLATIGSGGKIVSDSQHGHTNRL